MGAHFNNDLLIDGHGHIRRGYVRASARRRAQSLYGSDVTDLDIFYWREKLFAMASQQAALFRADHPVKRAEAA